MPGQLSSRACTLQCSRQRCPKLGVHHRPYSIPRQNKTASGVHVPIEASCLNQKSLKQRRSRSKTKDGVETVKVIDNISRARQLGLHPQHAEQGWCQASTFSIENGSESHNSRVLNTAQALLDLDQVIQNDHEEVIKLFDANTLSLTRSFPSEPPQTCPSSIQPRPSKSLTVRMIYHPSSS